MSKGVNSYIETSYVYISYSRKTYFDVIYLRTADYFPYRADKENKYSRPLYL